MLVKISNNAAINMLNIISVMIRQEEKTTYVGGSFFKAGEKKTTYDYTVEICYKNIDNRNATLNYGVGDDAKRAKEIKDEVLNQAKELENVGATQALEEALKNV